MWVCSNQWTLIRKFCVIIAITALNVSGLVVFVMNGWRSKDPASALPRWYVTPFLTTLKIGPPLQWTLRNICNSVLYALEVLASWRWDLWNYSFMTQLKHRRPVVDWCLCIYFDPIVGYFRLILSMYFLCGSNPVLTLAGFETEYDRCF